jgi:hypothetical protein
MKQHYFVKFDPRINQLTGCHRATLILSTLEYWFQKKPDGFYKFIEACPHRLYKEGDSWTEQLDCDPKSFSTSFKKIGTKYTSRSAFENAEDKFQGKMYASFYDRYTNQTFFVRNHEVANATLSNIFPNKKKSPKIQEGSTNNPTNSAVNMPIRIGKTSRSYKEPKNTSNNLSKDKSHAEEIIKKMIELWTALVEQGRGQIDLTGKRIAFLRRAFVDKFDSCLEKWKKYCQDIASSRFLMGEIKSSFRATLDWALKFDIIQKILDGNYGIGDRNPSSMPSACESFVKNSKIEIVSEQEAIQKSTDESELVRVFRLKWLNQFGASNYRECLKDCTIAVGDDATLILRPSSRYKAKSIASYWTPTLLVGSPFTKIHVIQQEGDHVFDKWFGLEPSREGGLPKNEAVNVKFFDDLDLTDEPIAQSLPESTNSVEIEAVNEKSPEEVIDFSTEDVGGRIPITLETQILRRKLKEFLPKNQFPTWLENIEVEGVWQDGTVVVTLEDALAVGWCRSRFSNEIFQSVSSLWKDVSRLIIRQKADDRVPLSVENSPKISEPVEEKSTLEQAIQSFLSVCSPKFIGIRGTQGDCLGSV